ncbi:MAG: glycosyltransferase, partial [Pseudonocardiaceae bacterium]
MTTVTEPTPAESPGRAARPILDVVVPVHNEQVDLGPCVHRVHRHLTETLPYPFRITIADNASTDATPAIAAALAGELPGVRVLRVAQR